MRATVSDRGVAHALIIFGAALFGLVSGGQALASPGCSATNSGALNYTFFSGGSSSSTVLGFISGDVVTATWVQTNAQTAQFSIAVQPANSIVASSILNDGPRTFSVTYTVTGSTGLSLFSSDGTGTATATCTPAASSSNTDSQKLQALQILTSKLVATSSGAAITGAIDGAISDAFSNSCNPFTAGPKSCAATRPDHAFSALGYAGVPTKAPARIPLDRVWSAWADVRGTGWNSNQTSGGFNGDQINVTAGLGRKLTPDFLIGVVAGYEHFNYDVAALTGTMKGDGGTIGGYAAWRILPTLRWDTTLAWSDIAYNGTAGTASGSFTGHRWLASTGLTGTYGLGATILEPSAKVYALWENENAYTDSLGTLQASRNFSAGMASAGGKLIYPWMIGNGTKLSPYAGLYGDYRFSTDNALPAGLPVVGIGDGWSARVTGGVAYTAAGGASLSLGGEYGGLGASYKIWTGNVRASMPF